MKIVEGGPLNYIRVLVAFAVVAPEAEEGVRTGRVVAKDDREIEWVDVRLTQNQEETAVRRSAHGKFALAVAALRSRLDARTVIVRKLLRLVEQQVDFIIR